MFLLSDDVEKVDNVADMMTSSTYGPQEVVSKNVVLESNTKNLLVL